MATAKLLIAGVLVAVAALAQPVLAADFTVKVAATAMPWTLKKNKDLPYSKGDGTPAATFAVKPGMLLHMTAIGSTTTVAGGGSFDPDGQADFITDDHPGGSGLPFPSMYMNHGFYPTHLNELVATFADSHGKMVKSPFPVGSHMTITVPEGAEVLQFGINDDVYADNSGEIDVTINVADAQPAAPVQ